jgi:hypothetical protein
MPTFMDCEPETVRRVRASRNAKDKTARAVFARAVIGERWSLVRWAGTQKENARLTVTTPRPTAAVFSAFPAEPVLKKLSEPFV